MNDDLKDEPESVEAGTPVDDDAVAEQEDGTGAAPDEPELATEAPDESAPETVSDAAPVAPPMAPKKKWHDRKWLLVTVVAIVGMILGVGMAAPDRQAAKDEADAILAKAEREARDEASDIVDDAKDEREDLLGDAQDEKADLLDEVEAAQGELADVNASIQTARRALRSAEKTRAQKQRQVDELNRAIRSSTSLSRENAVGKAQDYLDYDSFSCSGLIGQLEYEGYSNSDATYAAKQVGLC